MIKQILKNNLSAESKQKLKNLYATFISIICPFSLTQIAIACDTDKWGAHRYTPHYQLHFKKFKFKKINLLEIGIGGYANPKAGGQSLRMWKRYFPFSTIFGLDIHDKSYHTEPRIKIYKGSQVDTNDIQKIINDAGSFDLIVDDGSHLNEHVIETFKMLFPYLKEGGVYAVEDTQTAYWEDHGGDSKNLNNPKTMTSFFKQLTDGINYQELVLENYEPDYFSKNIVSIHFYHNLIFIHKGKNDEPSLYVKNNKRI